MTTTDIYTGLEAAIRAYANAKTEDEQAEAFEWVTEWVAADPNLPDDADFPAGAENVLRERGLRP